MGSGVPDGLPIEIFCPACGALIEASEMEELISRAKAHALDAHNYKISAEHVIQAAEEAASSQQDLPNG